MSVTNTARVDHFDHQPHVYDASGKEITLKPFTIWDWVRPEDQARLVEAAEDLKASKAHSATTSLHLASLKA